MPEDSRQIREAYFNACNFESLMRGIHFAVAWSALTALYTSRAKSERRHVLAFLVLALFIMSTVHMATFWAYVHNAFIIHGDTEDSIAEALDSYPAWFTGTTSISDLNAILADGILIWRTWVIWGYHWFIIVIPVATTILTLVFSIIATYRTVSNTSFGSLGVDYATALYSTSLITTILCTGLIVWRIISITRFSKSLKSYSSIMEILVESCMLYFVATLFALIAYIYSGPASEYASAFWTSMTGIAPTLIILRVASGKARPNDSWRDATPSGISTHSRSSKMPRFMHQHSASDDSRGHDLEDLESFRTTVDPTPTASVEATSFASTHRTPHKGENLVPSFRE
ncbi:hypothetical protein CYLTODRAFT_395535 [Cylindrobasidium torrendii FP15055 ss-10]|uniref:Uncharacterized protein n=1 Tax=Cylindrobasidium torrendii FP15055 ss-10 TaxID=1314674 RepID=A0A0D7BDU3_9AGAR|nr:hypothetical protein CYLTODRAFT_395535 [Cylindrobasidium torrendii FP15055 ss-10]